MIIESIRRIAFTIGLIGLLFLGWVIVFEMVAGAIRDVKRWVKRWRNKNE